MERQVIRPQTLERIHTTMHEQGKSFADLVEEQYGEDTMTTHGYVYGWYRYADGTDKQFRFPASRESELKQSGNHVTVEVNDGGKWNIRKGTVDWGGGNFVVTPR